MSARGVASFETRSCESGILRVFRTQRIFKDPKAQMRIPLLRKSLLGHQQQRGWQRVPSTTVGQRTADDQS